MFGELKDPADSDQHRTVTEKVALRLHDFWEGQWESLMKDTQSVHVQKLGVSSTARTVQRIEQLLAKGEISKATAQCGAQPPFEHQQRQQPHLQLSRQRFLSMQLNHCTSLVRLQQEH